MVLAADKDIEAAIRGVLARPEAAGIRPTTSDVFVEPGRDPGCFHRAEEVLLPLRESYSRALVVLDAAWDGAPAQNASELEQLMSERFARRSLADWVRPVVIGPELEVWVWSDSPNVANALGWGSASENLRSFLEAGGFWPAGSAKPPDPKRAFEEACRKVRLPTSSAVFTRLAAQVSFNRCEDPSFNRLKDVLREWFGRS